MKCPKCENQMVKSENTWFCGKCKIFIDDVVVVNIDELFYADAINTYYPLIAHEYHILYKFVKEQNYFGALLEFKDVVEILLKFPTLIAINNLWRKDKYTIPEEKAIIELLLSKPLSLGDWRELCRLFVELYKKMDKNKELAEENHAIVAILKPLLKAVYDFYKKQIVEKKDIVQWRNECIGHGALQSNLEEDDLFKNRFFTWLKALKDHLENNRFLYEQLEIFDASDCRLCGKECEKHIGEKIVVRLGITKYEQFPFILVRDHTTNIFDSYTSESVYILNYITGNKKKEKHELADIFAEKRKRYLSNEMLENLRESEESPSKITDDVFGDGEIDMLSKMSDEKDAFTPPKYIINDIKSFLVENDHGIFFLQIERGMGKTTLVRAMDQLAMGNVCFDDGQNNIAVRAYYINSMFSYRMDHFQNESIQTLINTENFGIPRLVLSNIPTNFIGGSDKKDDTSNISIAFAHFLNDMLCAYQKKISIEKLLYIIDGLDEIRYDCERTIFDCIPNSGLLDKGVYIILTGRHKTETSQWIQEKYALIEEKATTTAIYCCADENNKHTLKSYLAKQLYKKTCDTELSTIETKNISTIIEKGNHRFLYVKALRELLKADTFNIDELGNESILERYLNVLERKYGNGKHIEKIKRLLLIVALLDESVTIEELSYLHRFEVADLQFIGYLTDLKGLLHIDRTGIGETISASIGTMHEEWKHNLIDFNKNIVKEVINAWLDELKHSIDYEKDKDDILDGESYLVANLYTIVQNYHAEKLDFFHNENVRSFMFKLAKKLLREKTISNTQRSEKIYTSIISIIDVDIARGTMINNMELASVYISRGSCREDLFVLGEALTDYNQCIEIRERLDNMGMLLDENNLAKAYKCRSDAYYKMTEYEKSILDDNTCIEILERLRNIGKLSDENELAVAYRSRCGTYNQMTRYEDALIDGKRSIEIMEVLRKENNLYDENDLAKAYRILSVTCFKMFKYDEDIKYNNKSIEISEKLYNENKLSDQNDLAAAYNCRGGTYRVINQQDKAILDFNKSIEIMEQLRNIGKLFDENDLALAYVNRGDTYNTITEYIKAMADYNKALKIREHLNTIGKLFDKLDLAWVYYSRALTNQNMTAYVESLVDCNRVIEIMDRLHKIGKLYDENNLAVAYFGRGSVYDSMVKYYEAMADYSKCIEIRERLFNIGMLYDENDLALAYFNRAVTHHNMTEYTKAIADYNKCIEIRARLFRNGKLYDENDLAWTYVNRGGIYRVLIEYDKAMIDYNRGVQIMERLQCEGKLYDKNSLAWIYMNRGDIYHLLTEYDKAMIDYNRSVEIMERLHREGKLYDENNLAWVYQSLGDSYNSMAKYAEAMIDYNKCIEIRENLHCRSKLHNEDNLASAYMNRGCNYWSQAEYDNAFIDFNKCIEIRERLHREGRLFDENDLAWAYMNRGDIYREMADYEKAILDDNKCVEIRERLHGEGRLYDEDDLARIYLCRGEIYHAMLDYDKAMIDINKSIGIRERLHKNGKLFDENLLADAYMNRGNTLCKIKQYIDSLVNYNQCIAIKERLYNKCKLYDKNGLASAYLKRGELYHAMIEYEKALTDYDRCIEIRERLRDEGILYKENDLTMAYVSKRFTLDVIKNN